MQRLMLIVKSVTEGMVIKWDHQPDPTPGLSVPWQHWPEDPAAQECIPMSSGELEELGTPH